ncbi:MAG: nucleotide exchange factor GrpE [Flavipsychrobacter sp.]
MSENTIEKDQLAGDETVENINDATQQENVDEVNNEDSTEQEELDELGLAQKELGEMKDKYLRLVAEFDNYKKRTSKERIEFAAVAGRETIMPLLNVLDDSERARKQMEETDDAAVIKEGVLLVLNKLQSALESKGLKQMDAMHKDFDADYHEAITEIPAPSEDLSGKVLDVIEQGYYLNDKLIRHAKVVVGK